MKRILALKPIEMTPMVMEDLEKRNLILRLGPCRYELPSKWGQTLDHPVYDSNDRYGPHRLLIVTVNRVPFVDFATHPDNEKVLMIGDPNTKPLYLVIALMHREELADKIKKVTINSDDFICLRVTWNDSYMSFFTMLSKVPHGEAITIREGRPPSFYVTEGRDLPNDIVDLGAYELVVGEKLI